MQYPQGSTPLVVASGNRANGSAVAALAADSNQWNYVTGIEVTGCGATAASVVDVTLAGLYGGVTMIFKLAVPAGATTSHAGISKRFDPPLKSSAKNQDITLTVPALGAGNLHSTAHIFGYKAPE